MTIEVTDEMVEAGCRALYLEQKGNNPDWPIGIDKRGYHQEPYVDHVPAWKWHYEHIVRMALTAALAHAPKGDVAVKPLEWEERGGDWFANSPVGQYGVGVVQQSFIATLRFIDDDGQWNDDVFARGLGRPGAGIGLKKAKAAAQADYEARILSALVQSEGHSSPSPAQEAVAEPYIHDPDLGWMIDMERAAQSASPPLDRGEEWTADINNADEGWVQVTISGPDAENLSEAAIEVSLRSASPFMVPGGQIDAQSLHDALLLLVKGCHRDGVGKFTFDLDGVVADGEDAGNWEITITKIAASTTPEGDR